MALSPLLWVPETQVFMRLAEDAYPPLLCRIQLAQSFPASQLSSSHWCIAWNGITPILLLATSN